MESARRAAWTFSTIDHASSNEFSSNHYPVSISETLYLRLAVYLIRVLRQLYQRSNYPWFYVLLFHPYTFTVFSKVLPVAVAVCQRVFQYTNINIIIVLLLPLLFFFLFFIFFIFIVFFFGVCFLLLEFFNGRQQQR